MRLILTFALSIILFIHDKNNIDIASYRSEESIITLSQDYKFHYRYRGPSCYLWHDKKGTWSCNRDTLELKDTLEPYTKRRKSKKIIRIKKYLILKADEFRALNNKDLDDSLTYKKMSAEEIYKIELYENGLKKIENRGVKKL